MPEFEWSAKHKAYIKMCSYVGCNTKVFVGNEDYSESYVIFKTYFSRKPASGTGDNLSSDCKVCAQLSVRQSRGIKGVTIDTVPLLLKKQNGKCGICKTPLSLSGIAGQRPQVDHNQETGEYRELLCLNCNTGLGRFKDSIQMLEKAIRYLQRNRRLKPPKWVTR